MANVIDKGLRPLRFHQMLRPNDPSIHLLCFSRLHLTPRYLWIIPNFDFYSELGKAVANAISIILVIIRMKVIPDKGNELCQTIASLIGRLRTVKGCRRSDFCQNMEDENKFQLLEEWDTRGNLHDHLKSDLFRILPGTMNLLQQAYEMRVRTVREKKRRI